MARKRKKRPTSKFSIRSRIEPQTDAQESYFDAIDDYEITMCCGPAGSGKTLIPVFKACLALYLGEFEKIVITRPAIEAGHERLGFLPGTAAKKIQPYLMPVIYSFHNIIGRGAYERLRGLDKIQIIPLALMRGLNFDNSFIIVDEAENANLAQLELVMTRIGENSKMVVSGDFFQRDIGTTCYERLFTAMEPVDEVATVRLTEVDIMRNPIISKIIPIFRKLNEGSF